MKKNTKLTLSVVTLLVLSSPTLLANNLIQNGSFEDFSIDEDRGKRKMVTFSNWTGNGEVWNSKIGKPATDGEHKIKLDVGKEFNELSQIVTTIEGKKYKLSLDAYAGRKRTSDFQILIDGEILKTVKPDRKWAEHSAYFVGNGGEQVISLQELESQNNGRGAVIDNVKLQESSELIINGSFEEFAVHSDGGNRKKVWFTGWEGKGEVWNNRRGKRTTQGAYKSKLDAGREFNSLRQMVQTENGTEYSLSLDAYAKKLKTSDFEIVIDGNKIETITPTSKWENYSVTFFGNGEPQEIQITELDSQNNGRGAIIDNVSLVPIASAGASAPYDIPTFKSVLDQSDLQWQSSLDGHYDIKRNLVDVSTDYFYLSNKDHMTFEIADSGQKRVELRQKQEWTIATDVAMSGSVQCFPPNALKEYTFMQVFNRTKNTPSARLLWHAKKKKKINHLWAFVKTNDGERKVDLGANPEGLFDVDVSIVNSELVIKINDIVKLTQSVADDDYWDGDFYFKAGAYISGSINNKVPEGERGAKVEFESLNFH